eukprot:3331285-Prymnesium_polylepis.1
MHNKLVGMAATAAAHASARAAVSDDRRAHFGIKPYRFSCSCTPTVWRAGSARRGHLLESNRFDVACVHGGVRGAPDLVYTSVRTHYGKRSAEGRANARSWPAHVQCKSKHKHEHKECDTLSAHL